MERIDFTGSNIPLKSGKDKKVDKKHKSSPSGLFGVTEAEEASEQDFSFYLSSVVDEGVSLEELLDDVHSAGEKLIDKPFISNIKEYKESVRRFIGYIVKNAYNMESDVQSRKYMKNGMPVIDEKRWTKIKIVDQQLEKLAFHILQNQRSQLTILKKIEEIEGLLVDLMR
ncbi:MAG: YaaR family protein [Spirochaetales bacterium]|nr:YaaR family protein [Spirochaetales bacterium]